MVTAALLALLLHQTGNPPAPGPQETPPLPHTTLAPPETPLPLMDEGNASLCVTLAPTPQVPSGNYRVQCDAATLRCLAAPEHELEADGTESRRFLERAEPCLHFVENPLLRPDERYTFVPATAGAPPGWYRDERGRVMQFNFDLHRRVWLGGGWSPLWRDGEARDSRGRVDFGFITEFPSDQEHHMHRLTLFDTELVLGRQASSDFTLMRYDSNTRPTTPLLRVSTFVGKPRRFDFSFDVGMWVELLRVEALRRDNLQFLYYTLGTFHVTLDLWHSADLASYLRVRAGPSVEYDATNGFFTLVPGAVLEADRTLDANGFHHLTLGLEAEKIFLGRRVEGREDSPERLRVRAGYELILVAVNDQPVSLVVEGRGQRREDLQGLPAVWEWSAYTGLRFSLWAPARRTAPLAGAR